MSATTEATAKRLAAENDEVAERIRALALSLTPSQLAWKPEPRAWSIGEVLEHLVVVGESYMGRLQALVEKGRSAQPRAARAWRPSLIGRLFEHSLRKPGRLPAPRMYHVTKPPRNAVLDAFLAQQRTVSALIRESAGMDWRSLRTSAPLSALIRLNLGDAFAISVAHTARHAGQIERVRQRPDFPAPEARPASSRGASAR